MSSSWRMAGLNYVNYSNIAARVLRSSIKGLKEDPHQKKAQIRYFYWANGEQLPAGKKPEIAKDAKLI